MYKDISFVFFGSSYYCLPVIKELFKNTHLKAIITRPDKPIGRQKIISPSEPKKFALEKKLPVFTPTDKNALMQLYQDLEALSCDFFLVADYGNMIPEKIFKIPKYGSFNIHFSLLPQFRGASPVQYAILHGLVKSGISIVKMTPQLDDGDIYYQDEFIFNGVETTSELYPQLFTKISQHIPELFHNIKQKKASFIPQDHLKATYTKKINKIDGFLPWELIYHALKGNDYPMEKIKLLSLYNHFRNIPESNIRIPDFIYNAVRAFSPWPGIWTIIKVKNQKSKVKSDEKRMKILKVQLKNGGLVLDTVQLEGKNPVSFREFRNAYPQLFM